YSNIFFINTPPTSDIYTLSLHDALPISEFVDVNGLGRSEVRVNDLHVVDVITVGDDFGEVERVNFAGLFEKGMKTPCGDADAIRSEEHTSELQTPYDLVCRLLLEKKKDK